MNADRGKRVVVIGLGGIGSFFVPLLARIPGMQHITLIDRDSYDASNLRSQNIFRCDIGESKVAVQARRLRTVSPQLEVAAVAARVEDVPLGAMRADLIVACVDSRLSRQTINELAFHLGIPHWLDAGVLDSEQLARVNVYSPSDDAPCLECAFSAEDYRSLETEYPCGAGPAAETHSDSGPVVASLAATLLAGECRKLLCDDAPHAAIGRQVTVDLRTHRLLLTSFRRNPNCRFDHRRWQIEPLHCALQRLTLGEALDLTGRLRVAGHRFVRQLVCPGCGFRLDGLRLNRPKAQCRICGARMISPDFDSMADQLDASLPDECLSRSLSRIGLLPGDVVCGAGKNFELVQEAL